jgi:hypothetical protein
MVESFLPESVKMVLMGFGLLVIVLVMLAHKMPNVPWLQAFKVQDRRTEEQKQRARRTAGILDGFEMIIAGIAVPGAYLVSTVMFFSTPSPVALFLVGAVSVVLIGIGVGVIVKAARTRT